ncbi:MAG: CoB--CoM heterodisulfide reductase iron-sulfur subunit A family protein, partial [Candidatus Firestonebacteria bacterium]|nr:CoB--CoM heterodisulfide reductase iron-sulfur subunit A family protein [Candidatus Firestonebacteria bacterium]
RDLTVCNPMCCRIGCMYAIKQAQLLMGALPLAEVTIYLIDVRAFGKGYDEFFEQAKGMGVNFVKGKVARIEEAQNGNLQVFYEDLENGKGLVTANHDLAVLSVGLQPNRDLAARVKNLGLQQDALEYIAEVDELGEPGKTHVPGVFVAGAFTAPCDIPDAVVHASAAAAQAACYLSRAQAADKREKPARERA